MKTLILEPPGAVADLQPLHMGLSVLPHLGGLRFFFLYGMGRMLG